MNYDTHFKWFTVCATVCIVAFLFGAVRGSKIRTMELKQIGCEIRYRTIHIDDYDTKWMELVNLKDGAIIKTTKPPFDSLLEEKINKLSKEIKNDNR